MNPAATDRYAAIERMYSQGQWQQVLDASEALLASWQDGDDPALRQRLLLLQGHTQLHGLGQVEAAAALYQQVLDSQPEPVLLAVAQQELDRARSRAMVAEPVVEQAFPFTASAVGVPPAGQTAAAAPWLEGLTQSERAPQLETAATLTPVEVIEEPDQIVVHQADPATAEIVDLAPWSPAEEAELARGVLEVVLR